MTEKYVYAIAHSKKKNSLVGHPFASREEAEKHLPLYRAKGWTGDIVKLIAPKPLSSREKADLKQASKLLKRITGRE